jgi:RIO kinase 1
MFMSRGYREEWKTFGNVFDQFITKTLIKLCGQGHFQGIQSPVSIGKEANIFTALKEDDKVILKIYRLETCDFNKMYSYIRTDPRYQKLKRQRRQVIFAWAQREYRNLFKARDANVNVPSPLAFLNNVLVLEMIGDEDPAPQLKNLTPKNPKKFFKLLLDNMKKLYAAGLVHGDLSSFNILNDNENPVLIDFSQSTLKDDIHADEYLKRDIKNVIVYFNRIGLELDPEIIYNSIINTGSNKNKLRK